MYVNQVYFFAESKFSYYNNFTKKNLSLKLMMLIDTHCHLYLEEFESDLNDLITRAQQNSVEKIFLPAIDSETHQRLIALS